MLLHQVRLQRLPATLAALCATFLYSSLASADYVVQEATISRITNVADNAAKFAVLVAGGSGPCSNGWIEFPASAAVDLEAHKRAYATLLMAFASNLRVSIFNYSGNSCLGASYIEAFH